MRGNVINNIQYCRSTYNRKLNFIIDYLLPSSTLSFTQHRSPKWELIKMKWRWLAWNLFDTHTTYTYKQQILHQAVKIKVSSSFPLFPYWNLSPRLKFIPSQAFTQHFTLEEFMSRSTTKHDNYSYCEEATMTITYSYLFYNTH